MSYGVAMFDSLLRDTGTKKVITRNKSRSIPIMEEMNQNKKLLSI